MSDSLPCRCIWLLVTWSCARWVSAVTPLDKLPIIRTYAQRLSVDELHGSLQVSSSLLWKHDQLGNRLESKPHRHYVMLVQEVLQQDCCDYFTAVPLVKNLTEALIDVLDAGLPYQLYPVLRRSYVCSIWLLQRSRLFVWNTRYLQNLVMLGFFRLYKAHVDISAGRPISFHHISKSGGTSLCKIAQANGCKGPPMNKATNCILNTGLDGPIWAKQHDVLAANGIPQPPPQPPGPPPKPFRLNLQIRDQHDASSNRHDEELHSGSGQDDDAGSAAESQAVAYRGGSSDGLEEDVDGEDSQDTDVPDEAFEHKPTVTVPKVSEHSQQWFMYDCSKMLPEKAAYGCQERQEAVMEKSATFFANEHALSLHHGKPQVCSAFTNMVMVREPLSEVVSLMGEVIQVYTRLLTRRGVNVWQPPRWNLTWWEQQAPVVISSYSTRTLLGAPAFCPAQPNRSLLSSSSGSDAGNKRSHWLMLSQADTETALDRLFEFDVVLELGSQDLIDRSVSKLLGWSGQMFSARPRERKTTAARVLTWQQLEHLAAQQPPAQAAAAAAAAAAKPPAASADSSSKDLDAFKRMVAEYQIRQAYSDHQVQYVITPLLPGHKPPQDPPASAKEAAIAALHQVKQSVFSSIGGNNVEGKCVVQMQQRYTAGVPQSETTTTTAAAAPPGTAISQKKYHIWPRHGVVLDDEQYKTLSQLTAADEQLHKHARLLQLVDAAWLTALSQHSKYAKLTSQLIEGSDKLECGLAAA